MALAGNTRELSLADLIVVKAQDPGSYRFTLSGPAGDGLIFIEDGKVVHAAYGELPPEDAAYLLVTEENVDFELEAEATISGHTIELEPQELLMEAVRRLDEGLLKKPRRIRIEISTISRREPPRPRAVEARRTPEAEALRRAMGRVLFAEPETKVSVGAEEGRTRGKLLVGGAILLPLAMALVAWQLGWLSTAGGYREPVEVSDLEGPRDALPRLVSGAPAFTPQLEAPLVPTITCRILIDARGKVREAQPYQPRSGLEAYEQAALAAVREYRFQPAVREGLPVPAFVNWPVDFVRRREISESPVPVEAVHFSRVRDGDKLPELLEGEHPVTPLPERALRPKITCRVLVDEAGRVASASVLNPRTELELYERVALDTVGSYRFTPGEREGVPVPAWVNWTVEFQ